MKYGESEASLVRQAKQLRQPVPEFIRNAPELREGLQLYLQAFFDLSSERTNGFSVGSIPGQAVRRYALDYDFDEEQTESLIFFIRNLDNAYVKYHSKKNEANS